jgi:murein L,D-transpeptidase YafK
MLHGPIMKQLFFFIAFLACLSGFASRHSLIVAKPSALHVEEKKNSEPERIQQRAEQERSLKLPLKHPRIVIIKSKRRLELYSQGRVVRTYKVGLGFNPVPDKVREGDGATPEGDFYVFTKNDKSAYYLSLGVSYPNIEDAARGLRDRLISRKERDVIVRAIQNKAAPPQHTALGGLIYIHGNGAKSDWTWGCVALENEDIRELFDAAQVGTPVTIKP